MVYSFDREAGVFTQFDTISFDYGNQFVGEIGCAVSPNNRYLYLSCREFLYQLDLWSPDISASQVTVAQWDGFKDPLPTMFWQLQLGPDCKIYGIGGSDTRYYHVIHNPDEPGLACNVEQRGVKFQTPTGVSMPSFPNYRLGPIDNPGVPCTATVSTVQPVRPSPGNGLKLYPNPASDAVTVEYSGLGGSGQRLLLFNVFGQAALEVSLPEGQGSVLVSLSALPAGVNWYAVPGVGRISGKLVINR
jgi:hypothetical protein